MRVWASTIYTTLFRLLLAVEQTCLGKSDKRECFCYQDLLIRLDIFSPSIDNTHLSGNSITRFP